VGGGGVRFDGCFEANLSEAGCCLTLINRSCRLDSTLSSDEMCFGERRELL